jgi:hypothetical protein
MRWWCRKKLEGEGAKRKGKVGKKVEKKVKKEQ